MAEIRLLSKLVRARGLTKSTKVFNPREFEIPKIREYNFILQCYTCGEVKSANGCINNCEESVKSIENEIIITRNKKELVHGSLISVLSILMTISLFNSASWILGVLSLIPFGIGCYLLYRFYFNAIFAYSINDKEYYIRMGRMKVSGSWDGSEPLFSRLPNPTEPKGLFFVDNILKNGYKDYEFEMGRNQLVTNGFGVPNEELQEFFNPVWKQLSAHNRLFLYLGSQPSKNDNFVLNGVIPANSDEISHYTKMYSDRYRYSKNPTSYDYQKFRKSQKAQPILGAFVFIIFYGFPAFFISDLLASIIGGYFFTFVFLITLYFMYIFYLMFKYVTIDWQIEIDSDLMYYSIYLKRKTTLGENKMIIDSLDNLNPKMHKSKLIFGLSDSDKLGVSVPNNHPIVHYLDYYYNILDD